MRGKQPTLFTISAPVQQRCRVCQQPMPTVEWMRIPPTDYQVRRAYREAYHARIHPACLTTLDHHK